MYITWVITKAINGAETITLVASSLILKDRKMVKIREYPRRITADE